MNKRVSGVWLCRYKWWVRWRDGMHEGLSVDPGSGAVDPGVFASGQAGTRCGNVSNWRCVTCKCVEFNLSG